jgi:predicted ATPase
MELRLKQAEERLAKLELRSQREFTELVKQHGLNLKIRDRVVQLRSEYHATLRSASEEKERLAQETAALADAVFARNLIQVAAQLAQETAHAKVASVVTRCLRAVFGSSAPEFAIQFDRKRGRTEARLVFVVGGHEVDPQDADSGGLLDVAAFALRLSVLCLRRPPLRRLLVLDEPWKHLSAGYRPAVRELVESLAEELGVQFLVVTHSSELRIGTVVEF